MQAGLSPLARGTLRQSGNTIEVGRFIPAGAGNTLLFTLYCGPTAVYPRWRGEHTLPAAQTGAQSGLSPLARGTRRLIRMKIDSKRFIPAGAGNTPRIRWPPSLTPVYPRWRGEHPWFLRFSRLSGGLSPLARGTHRHKKARRLTRRFIPAGAGNTAFFTMSSVTISVYPRWRGEHDKEKPSPAVNTGLSPLARGTHTLSPCRISRPRFIPAGAGNTYPVQTLI